MTFSVIMEIVLNKLFYVTILTWALGMVVKLGLYWKERGKITFNDFLNQGGMPSTHVVVVTALTTVVYLAQGVGALFVVTFVLSVIVIRDSVGVRLDVQNISKLLNKKMQSQLNENVGHELKEVIFGVVFGIVVAALLYGFL